MRTAERHLILIGMIVAVHVPVHAGLISPEVGWQAELATLFHDVSGTVTIVDDDTVRVDDFVFDGGGPLVFFYLGTSNTDMSFESGPQGRLTTGCLVVRRHPGSANRRPTRR